MTGSRPKDETQAENLVRLPQVGETSILLVAFGDGAPHSITARKALELIRKAKREGRPAWLIVG